MSFIIKKPIEPGAVVTFRLVTGDQVLARWVSRDTTSITVSKPIIAQAVHQAEGIGISFAPFCVTAPEDQEYKIPATSLLFDPISPHPELGKSYMRATTGLEIPGA